MTASTMRIALNLILPVVQIGASGLSAFGIGADQGTRSAESPNLFTPAGYAFSIWGPIFALMIGYGIYQALPAQRANPVFARIGWYTIAAMAGTSLWSVIATIWGLVFWTVPVLLFVAVSLGFALERLNTAGGAGGIGGLLFVHLAIGLFGGWTTAATIANAASWLSNEGGFDGAGIAPVYWVAGTAVIGGIVAAIVLKRIGGSIGYFAAFAWALGAIIYRMLGIDATVPAFAAVIAILMAAGGHLAGRRARSPVRV
ncbi:MAG: hypothetical protein WA906_08435 [Pacificimonas sp.]